MYSEGVNCFKTSPQRGNRRGLNHPEGAEIDTRGGAGKTRCVTGGGETCCQGGRRALIHSVLEAALQDRYSLCGALRGIVIIPINTGAVAAAQDAAFLPPSLCQKLPCHLSDRMRRPS